MAEARKTKLSAFQAIFSPVRDHAVLVRPHDAMVEEQLCAARERIAALRESSLMPATASRAEELALYSRSVDLLVIGSRGYGPIGRVVHGNTAQKLARTARCPLLVLTRGGTTHGAG